ncbi:hypothetical protein GCM10009730_67790 [Streptomyces albidochromogenes]
MDESREQTQNHDGAQPRLQYAGTPLPSANGDPVALTSVRGRATIGLLEFPHVC